jgi:hypothetical protein
MVQARGLAHIRTATLQGSIHILQGPLVNERAIIAAIIVEQHYPLQRHGSDLKLAIAIVQGDVTGCGVSDVIRRLHHSLL